MAEHVPEVKPNLSAQEYAMRLLQMLQDYGDEYIKVDSVIVIVKMLTRHPLENAVVFATGDAYQFGACEFDNPYQARKFLNQLSDNVAYAAFIEGEFEVFRYPYRSRVMDEWVFVGPDS